eukprot:679407-Pleurochrysis_carterae.AAC.2
MFGASGKAAHWTDGFVLCRPCRAPAAVRESRADAGVRLHFVHDAVGAVEHDLLDQLRRWQPERRQAAAA